MQESLGIGYRPYLFRSKLYKKRQPDCPQLREQRIQLYENRYGRGEDLFLGVIVSGYSIENQV